MIKVCPTLMPTYITLTLDEKKKLDDLEQAYGALAKTNVNGEIPLEAYSLMEVSNIKNTTNIGIHYFCIKNDISLRDLAANENISAEVATLVLAKANAHSGSVTASSIRRNLLFNSASHRDLLLFKLILGSFPEGYKDSVLFALSRFLVNAPIDIFMFLVIEKEVFSSYLSSRYIELAKLRSEDISSWASENAPELSGLPASWILRAYNFPPNE